jgi:archaellum component FlaC
MGLINKDYTAREEYYAKLRMVKSQKDEINTIKSDIDSLRGDMKDIKSLLEQLLEKNIHG